MFNTVKNGATVPIRFRIFKGSTQLTSTSIINQPLTAVGVACNSTQANDIELLASGETSLRYDSTAGEFVYNWQTPKNRGACYKVTVSSLDGSSQTAYFQLK